MSDDTIEPREYDEEFYENKDRVIEDEIKPKPKRGRPRIHPIKVVDPDAPVKGRGRPKKLDEFYKDGKFDDKAYYISRKGKLNDRNSAKTECKICGKMVRYDYVSIHIKTNLCLKNAK